MGWRDYAERVQSGGDKRDNRDISSDAGAFVPNVPNVPAALPLDPKGLQRVRASLGGLDAGSPLHGLPADRWRQLIDDAEWLAETFGTQAARDGWSAADLFGRWPGLDGMGGIADRLSSSRSLVMSADKAVWRIGSVTFSYNRGSYDLPLIWTRE